MIAPATMHRNPLARMASAISARTAFFASFAATVLGLLFAVAYAYNQDTLFPGEHFPRTWALVALMSAMGVLSLVALPSRAGAFLHALGPGVLIFGAANLSGEPEGMAALGLGIVAWLAAAVGNEGRGAAASHSVAGLFVGALVTFAAIAAILLIIPA